MPPWIASLALVAPTAVLAVALLSLVQPGLRPRLVLASSRVATLVAVAVAIAATLVVLRYGALTGPLIGVAGIGISVRLDALSAVMFLLVSFIGVIVVRFSGNYLDGDGRQGAFVGGLCLTLAAVTLMVLAGNLAQLILAWIATSLALHRLLVFYRERQVATVAARKKFVTARLGDACLVGAAVLLTYGFGTTDIAAILAQARALAGGAVPDGVPAAALLIATAALLKSAQFPAHGWLPEVIETPTPVSALLHAGIINAGGFLVIRFADVMLLSPPSLHLLALVGGFTALFGGVVMLTQSSVKISLAWSTIAQMGFMLLQCGLGAFSLAVLHIVAHSLYKAHAFLSSGSVVDIARAAWVARPGARPPARHLLLGLVLAFALYAGIGCLFGVIVQEAPAVLALGAILILGLTLLIAQSMEGGSDIRVVARTLAAAGGATVAYFVLQHGAAWLLTPALPPIPPPGPAGLLIMALAVTSFAAVTLLQIMAPAAAGSPAWRATRVHLANGLYANAVFDRVVGALKRRAAAPL